MSQQTQLDLAAATELLRKQGFVVKKKRAPLRRPEEKAADVLAGIEQDGQQSLLDFVEVTDNFSRTQATGLLNANNQIARKVNGDDPNLGDVLANQAPEKVAITVQEAWLKGLKKAALALTVDDLPNDRALEWLKYHEPEAVAQRKKEAAEKKRSREEAEQADVTMTVTLGHESSESFEKKPRQQESNEVENEINE